MTRMDDKLPADEGPGERAEHSRKRRFWRIIAAGGAVGAIVGITLSLTEGRSETILTGTMSAPVAVGLALLWLVAMSLGMAFAGGHTDEHEHAVNRWAGSLGGLAVFAFVYPTWFFLWKGRMVVEPNHLALFVIFLVTAGGAYLYKKSR